MRIGIVSNLRGGLRQFVVGLSLGLKRRGFQPEVICPLHLTPPELKGLDLGLPFFYGLTAVARMFRRPYDIIHCNIATLALLPSIRHRFERLPLIETFHGIPQWWIEPTLSGKVQYATEYRAVQAIGKGTSSRVSISRFVQWGLSERFGLVSSVVYHGIDRCLKEKPTRDESRQLLGVDKDTVAILAVGRLHPYKDPFTLLRAVGRLVKDGYRVKLLVVGDGPLSQSYAQKVRELGLERIVARWSHIPSPQMHSIYTAADIFCLPSINEAFGLVLLEAMDHSLPLVVSRSGGLPEIVGDAGLTFKVGDDIDLSRRMASLVDSSSFRDSLGRRGLQRLQTHFSLNSMVDQYTQIYNASISA